MLDKNILIKVVFCAILIIAGVFFFFPKESNMKAASGKTMTIGLASNPYIQDLSTNYYKKWLEEQTDLKLQFIRIPSKYTEEYLNQMFQSGNVPMDAVFSFPVDEESASASYALQKYASKGYFLPLNDYIKNSDVMQNIFYEFTDYNLKKVMTSPDGNIYYMPGLDSSSEKEYPQIMWINTTWLKTLNLKIPESLEELKTVLEAFKAQDPNGNGQNDEIPLTGSMDYPSEQTYNFIINSFVYNDPENCRMVVQDGKVSFAPLTSEWRDAVKYLHALYQEGLLDSFQFTITHQQLVQLANDPRNLLGAFTSSSITDILLSSSPEIMSNYVRVAPLSCSDAAPYATVKTPLPKPNGVIFSSCKNPDEVFRVFELMLSKEAFLIGRYGEKEADWQYAKPGDIDIFGNQATIRVKTQLWNKVQNKHLLELGPFFAYTKYTNGVAWNGIESDQEYINARAYNLYRQYRPPEFIKTIIFEGENSARLTEIRKSIDDYTNTCLKKFIQDKMDPYNDSQWNEYISQYKKLGIDELTLAVQHSYDELLIDNAR